MRVPDWRGWRDVPTTAGCGATSPRDRDDPESRRNSAPGRRRKRGRRPLMRAHARPGGGPSHDAEGWIAGAPSRQRLGGAGRDHRQSGRGDPQLDGRGRGRRPTTGFSHSVPMPTARDSPRDDRKGGIILTTAAIVVLSVKADRRSWSVAENRLQGRRRRKDWSVFPRRREGGGGAAYGAAWFCHSGLDTTYAASAVPPHDPRILKADRPLDIDGISDTD